MNKKMLNEMLNEMQCIRILQSHLAEDMKNLRFENKIEDWNNIEKYIKLADESWKKINKYHKMLSENNMKCYKCKYYNNDNEYCKKMKNNILYIKNDIIENCYYYKEKFLSKLLRLF